MERPPAAGINFSAISLAARHFAYPDTAFAADLTVANRHIADRVLKADKSELSVARRNNTSSEVERGWAAPPAPNDGRFRELSSADAAICYFGTPGRSRS